MQMSILRRCSKGQIMVWFAIALPALLGVLALTCDMSVMYMNWQAMQRAADAAVLSGAGWLNGTDSTGDTKAISTANNFAASNGIQSTEIVAGPTVSADHKTITITLSRTVPYLFGRVVGLFTAPVQVTATAGIEAVNGAGGNHLVPFGFTCPGPPCMSAGTSFILPGDLNTTRLSPGNWGALDFPDGQNYGGANYAKTIVTGYQGTTPILIGDTSGVVQQPGNDVNQKNSGPAGLANRYAAGTEVPSTTNPADLANPNDPRVIIIPMVDSWTNGKGTNTPADITGFITALIVPEPGLPGQFYGVVVSTSDSYTVASLNGPDTGTTKAVLLR
jgi:Flp pilus assembly protein TadG